MSIETLMTLGLTAVIFVIGLLLFGILTTFTRVAVFVLRPAARGGYSLARRYAPVAAARLAAFWERTSPAITAVGHRLGAEAGASIDRAAAIAASWGRRLSAEAAAWARRSAGGATRLSERSAESLTTYVTPAVRSWFTDDEDLGWSPPSRRVPRSLALRGEPDRAARSDRSSPAPRHRRRSASDRTDAGR